jgi:hypothetical protein
MFLSFFDSSLSKIIVCVILVGIGFLYYKKTREGMVNKQQGIVNKQPTHDAPNFIQHDSFGGGMKGYVFKMDKSGLGYYKDLVNIRKH